MRTTPLSWMIRRRMQQMIPLDIELAKQPPRRGGESSPSDRSSGKTSETRDLRVLVVEDEIFVADNAAAILESDGFEVVGMAATADDAVKKAKKFAPDLVLMDIRLLGERDGIDAAIEIRDRLGIRSIFLSAFDDPRTRGRAAAAEPFGFLTKPFTQKSLLDGIRELLD